MPGAGYRPVGGPIQAQVPPGAKWFGAQNRARVLYCTLSSPHFNPCFRTRIHRQGSNSYGELVAFWSLAGLERAPRSLLLEAWAANDSLVPAFLRHDDGRAPGCELLVGVPRAQLMLHVEAPLCSPSRAPRSRAWQLGAAWTSLRAEQWFQPLSVAAAPFPPQPGTRRMAVGMGYPAQRRRAAPWPCYVDQLP